MDDLMAVSGMEDIDIIDITKSLTGVNDSINLEIKGFNYYRKDRVGRKGGGLLYTGDCLSSRDLSICCTPEEIESV